MPLAFPMVLVLWIFGALLLGTALAVTGMVGIYGLVTLALLLAFGITAAKFPTPVMGLAVWLLALFPFSWGIWTGVLPKFFGDEAFLVPYLVIFPFLYVFTSRRWRHGFAGLYLVLIALVCMQSISFLAGTDLVAFRNYLETFVLGGMLLVLYLQEGCNSKPQTVGKFVIGATVAVAALSLVEWFFQSNPTVSDTTRYLSADVVGVAGTIYRPYVSFFHPSEAAVFMALGIPLTVRSWLQRKSWLLFVAMLILSAALLVNATRGVWVGVLVVILVEVRYAWKVVLAATPVAVLGGWIAYIVSKDSPITRKLIDPEDLYARLEYWSVAWSVFLKHPLIGVGHMQFSQVYLNYVHDVSKLVAFDISNVSVVDNMFLTTLAENGLPGFLVLAGFLFYITFSLRRFRKALEGMGLTRQATFVRCSELALLIYLVSGCFADVQLFTKATKLVFILVGLGLAEGARNVSSGGVEAQVNQTGAPALLRRLSGRV